jgi:hypothetical protein
MRPDAWAVPRRYADFAVRHIHETLVREHNYKLCDTVTRLALQSAGLVRKATLRGKHRKKRERRPLPGMLLFQEGSTHRHHYVRATVRVHQYTDATLALFDEPRCLARYDRDAKLIQPNEQRAA